MYEDHGAAAAIHKGIIELELKTTGATQSAAQLRYRNKHH
jgi:hypothetical protein